MFAPPTPDTILAGALKIRELMAGDKPFFIGRNGTIETEVLFFWLSNRQGPLFIDYPARLSQQIQQNAGVFPNTSQSIDKWCAAYMDALKVMDGGAAGWYKPIYHLEQCVMDLAAPSVFRTPLRSLEPYYVAAGERWTETLAGKRVAVVSSFADTMRTQIGRPIWPDGLLDISGVEWSFIRTGYAPIVARGQAEWPECPDWDSAVTYVVEKAAGADVALIGCGALGMIIAGRLRRQGVSCIVLGGAIQVLFGIKGRRWAQHDVISGFWNDAWVSPAAHEVPGGAGAVEGGCYW